MRDLYHQFCYLSLNAHMLTSLRPRSNVELHMCRTKLGELSSCEVRRLTQLSSTVCIRIDFSRTFDIICRKKRPRIDSGSNVELHMCRTKFINYSKTSFEKKLFFCVGEYAEYGFDQQG